MFILRNSLWRASGMALAATLLAPVTAHAGEIVGTVSDASKTRALQAAQLRIVELNRAAVTDRDGSFRFPDVPAGTYTIEARYVGANTNTTTVTVGETDVTKASILLGTDDAILVVGQTANFASSLSRQRAADGVESVLTRDSIGQFPDQNVAESLRRLPGVNILNDQGEGRFVSVRGLDPELNAASINGVRVPAPESDVRSVALDVIPSELIESIEVKKSLTPDMDADTIGASVEIKTTSVFDRKKDLLSFKMEGSYNDYSGSVTPKASFDFSKRITDNFGIAGGFSYYKRKFETDNIEAENWGISEDGVAYAGRVNYRDYDVERERMGGTLNLDWRPSDSTKLYVRGLYSQFKDQEYRGDVIFRMDDVEPVSGTATSASFTDADGRIEVRRRMKDRNETQKIKSVTAGGETVTGPWTITYAGSWSEASEVEHGSLDPTLFRGRFDGDGVGLTFNYANPRQPLYTIDSGASLLNDPSAYGFNELEETALSNSKDREYMGRFDVAREFAAGAGTFTVQAGVKARWRKKSYDKTTNLYDGFDGDYSLADVLGGQTYRIENLGPLPSQHDPRDFFNKNRGDFELAEYDSALESNLADYSVQEDILAGYLLGRWDSGKLRVIGGVRMERTYNDIRAKTTDGGDGDTVVVTPLQFTRSYTDWLPSLTFRYEPVHNIVMRLAGYKNLVRPKLSNLAPRFSRNDDLEVEVGNPELKPYRAWNIDASAEWYFAKDAQLSAGFFWKSIEDFVVQQVIVAPGELYGLEYSQLTSYINGDTGKIKGVEVSYSQIFSFLPAPFDGLLINANYTYTDAKGTVLTDGDITRPRSIPLMASAQNTFNVVLGYEKGPLSLRAAGTYRDKYLDELGPTADQDRYVDEQFQLDLSAKYRILPGIRVFGEWVNATNAPYFAYQNYAGAKRIRQYEQYNWTIKAGVTASF